MDTHMLIKYMSDNKSHLYTNVYANFNTRTYKTLFIREVDILKLDMNIVIDYY